MVALLGGRRLVPREEIAGIHFPEGQIREARGGQDVALGLSATQPPEPGGEIEILAPVTGS